MKQNILITSNIIMALAIVLLFLLFGKNKVSNTKDKKMNISAISGNGKVIPFAYINSDSVLYHYSYYHKLKDELQSKQKRMEQDYSSKMKNLESDYYQYQEKVQKGILTRAEMQSHESSLQQRQQELGMLNQKLTEELALEEQKMQKQLYDSVKLVTDLFNKDYGFKIIFNSATSVSIVTADSSMDITQHIVDLLNNRYKK